MKHIHRDDSQIKVITSNVNNMSVVITKMYAQKEVNKGLLKQLTDFLIEEKYVDCAIYLYKRKLIEFSLRDLNVALLELNRILRPELHKGFKLQLKNGKTHKFTMYLIKNKYVLYERTYN